MKKSALLSLFFLLTTFCVLNISCNKDDGSRAPNTISILDNSFSPASLTVFTSKTVTWTNKGSGNHTVTWDAGYLANSSTLAPGQTYSVTFTTKGTYPYHCSFHGTASSGMRGVIIVE